MKSIKKDVVDNALHYWRKHTDTPFLAFLSSKLAGISTDKAKGDWTNEDKRFLNRFLTIDGKYYNPCEGSHPNEKYYTTLHQYRHRASMGYSTAFEKTSKGRYKFSKDYIALTKSHAIRGKVSLTQIASWLYRNEQFEESDNAESLREKFIKEFGIRDEELSHLFDDDSKNQNEMFDETLLNRDVPIQSLEDESIAFSPLASDIEEPIDSLRTSSLTYRIIRDTALSSHIKKLYDFTCQICGKTIELGNDQRYAEAHHLKPLGTPHRGPDIASNIICVCPDDHVRLDYGALKLEKTNLLRKPNHEINDIYIDYHNSVVCNNNRFA